MKDKINTTASVLVLLCCTIFIILLFYYRPILGDDVLYQFEKGAIWYLDDIEMSEYEQILTFPQAVKTAHFFYMNWTGRFYHNFLSSLISIWGKGLVAVLAGIIFALFIISILTLAFSSLRKALTHPLLMLLLFLVLIFYNRASSYYFMWIMIITYVLPSAMFLIYLFLFDQYVKEHTAKRFYMLNILGFFCGIAHEMLGAFLIIMLLGKGISVVSLRKEMKFWSYVSCHIGFILGYIICFFAPGNFNRMNSSHDQGINRNYFDKLIDVLLEQRNMLYPSGLGGLGISVKRYTLILGLIICVGMVLVILSKKWKEALADNLYLLFGLVSSPFLWAFGSYMGGWAACFWNALFFILLFKLAFGYVEIGKIMPKWIQRSYLNIVCLMVASIIIIANNVSWFTAFIQTSHEWNRATTQAKEDGETAVIVPKYPNVRILMTGYINDPVQYEEEYYIKYYGIKIIPE